ncbi:MAG: imidazole glycerol phosphate synthase subunit HisH [Treponemataceae bacterium]|nr:MAG: imidazole glycerol phosphate synthase subunit HisH [Treponemataceae bacterium]
METGKIGIIDYNAGNITSVAHALTQIGCEYTIAKDPKDLENAQKIIFPGVGDAGFALAELKKSGFDDFLRNKCEKCVPILGICLGAQIIFDYSEESETQCLGLVRGKVVHLKNLLDAAHISENLKIPHMGWNSINIADGETSGETGEIGKNCPLLCGIPRQADFYFVHSYVIQSDDQSNVVATASYGIEIPAVIQAGKNGTLFAAQFHPEKSGAAGLRLLENFIKL